MNFKTTIILFVLVVIVGVTILITGQGDQIPPPPVANSVSGDVGEQLLNVQSDHVTLVRIADVNNDRAGVQKFKTSWRMTEPVSAIGAVPEIEKLIDALIALRSQGKPTNVSVEETGLDHPRYRIEVAVRDGDTYRLAIGKKTSIGDQTYAQMNNGDVNLISTSIEKSLENASSDLRDKHLVALRGEDVLLLKIAYGGKMLWVSKINGKWWVRVGETKAVPGDVDAIDSLINSINQMKVSEFIKSDSDELLHARFDYPAMQLWISALGEKVGTAATQPTTAPSTGPSTQPAKGRSSKPTTLPSFRRDEIAVTIGAADTLAKEFYFIRTSDGVFGKITPGTMDDFKKTVLDLRDRDVLTLSPALLRTIAIEKQIFPAAEPTTRGGPVAAPMAVPMQQVVLTRRSIHKRSSMGLRSQLPMPDVAPATQPTTATTRPDVIPTTQPGEAQPAWQIAGDPKAQVNNENIDALLKQLDPLRATKYLEKRPSSPTSRHYIVDVTMLSGAMHHFEVTVPANGGSAFAMCDGLTFEVSSDLVDALEADFHATTGQ